MTDQTAVPLAKRWILAATILGSSMVFINSATVNVALPAFQTELNATVSDIQWIVNSYSLMLAALILIGGSLGDRFGRRRLFLAGVMLFTLASMACGVSQTAVQLIIARAVQGLGGALLTPGSLAIISASFPQEERGAAIGLWSGFSALTAAAGPLLGGWLVDQFSWRWIFFIYLPFSLLIVPITRRCVPESWDNEIDGGVDWLGALLVTLGLGLSTFALIQANSRSLLDPLVIGVLLCGLVLLFLFAWLQTRLPFPMVPPALFRSRSFSGANALTLLLYMALGGALFFLPLNLIQVQGYRATAAGAAFLPMILLISLLSRWTGSLVETVGPRLLLILGPAIAAIGYGLMMRPGIGGSYWTTFFPPLVVLGFGMALSVAPLTTTVMTAVPDHFAGTVSGVNNAVSRIASLLAVALLGVVMLSSFTGQLENGLAQELIRPETADFIWAQRSSLAAIELPAGLEHAEKTAVFDAIHTAFVRGFRVVNAIACALALGSALIAAATLPPNGAENR